MTKATEQPITKINFTDFLNVSEVTKRETKYCTYFENGYPDVMVKEVLKEFYPNVDSSFWVHSRFVTDKRVFSVTHLKSGRIKVNPAPWFSKNKAKTFAKNEIKELFDHILHMIMKMYSIALKNDFPFPRKCPVYIRFFNGEEKRENRLKRIEKKKLEKEKEKEILKKVVDDLAMSMGKKKGTFADCISEL